VAEERLARLAGALIVLLEAIDDGTAKQVAIGSPGDNYKKTLSRRCDAAEHADGANSAAGASTTTNGYSRSSTTVSDLAYIEDGKCKVGESERLPEETVWVGPCCNGCACHNYPTQLKAISLVTS